MSPDVEGQSDTGTGSVGRRTRPIPGPGGRAVPPGADPGGGRLGRSAGPTRTPSSTSAWSTRCSPVTAPCTTPANGSRPPRAPCGSPGWSGPGPSPAGPPTSTRWRCCRGWRWPSAASPPGWWAGGVWPGIGPPPASWCRPGRWPRRASPPCATGPPPDSRPAWRWDGWAPASPRCAPAPSPPGTGRSRPGGAGALPSCSGWGCSSVPTSSSSRWPSGWPGWCCPHRAGGTRRLGAGGAGPPGRLRAVPHGVLRQPGAQRPDGDGPRPGHRSATATRPGPGVLAMPTLLGRAPGRPRRRTQGQSATWAGRCMERGGSAATSRPAGQRLGQMVA